MYIQLECDGEIYWIKALENPPISDSERQFMDMQDDIIEKKVSYSHNIRNKLACTFQFKTLKTGSVIDN